MSTDSKFEQVKLCAATVKENPHSDVVFQLVDLYCELGLIDAAVEAVKTWLSHNPDSVAGLLRLGELQFSCESYDDARSIFERIVRYDEKNRTAYLKLIELEIKQSNFRLARQKVESFRQLFSVGDDLNRLETQLDDVSYSGGLVEPDEGSAPAIVSSTMADLYFRQGLVEKALVLYRQLLDCQPDNQLYKNRIEQLEFECGGGKTSASKDDQKAADVLTRWLAAIEQRRSHV